MTHFAELSDYEYRPRSMRPGTRNIGWLSVDHDFEKAPPNDLVLGSLWECCKISVAGTRGVHTCELCDDPHTEIGERNGERLLLGMSEIRVFSPTGEIFAAPTLIYHYVLRHQYRPPQVFLDALLNGPRPPSKEYFATLQKLGLDWRPTSSPTSSSSGLDQR